MFFHITLEVTTNYINFKQFPIKWSFGRNFQTFDITLKMTFIVIVKVLEFLPIEAQFYWKLLIIGIVSAKGIRKNVPVLQVGGQWARPFPSHMICN